MLDITVRTVKGADAITTDDKCYTMVSDRLLIEHIFLRTKLMNRLQLPPGEVLRKLGGEWRAFCRHGKRQSWMFTGDAQCVRRLDKCHRACAEVDVALQFQPGEFLKPCRMHWLNNHSPSG